MKVNELTGSALDWAVAKCEGWETVTATDNDGSHLWIQKGDEYRAFKNYRYSTNWAQGGPIIEREGIFARPKTTGGWRCWIYDGKGEGIKFDQHGTTPLIAAMRCYVASKMGDEVEVPDELQ
jgi:hypothetical protein